MAACGLFTWTLMNVIPRRNSAKLSTLWDGYQSQVT
jgi:hypothetical protein